MYESIRVRAKTRGRQYINGGGERNAPLPGSTGVEVLEKQ